MISMGDVAWTSAGRGRSVVSFKQSSDLDARKYERRGRIALNLAIALMFIGLFFVIGSYS
jgi:hypothetical protein